MQDNNNNWVSAREHQEVMQKLRNTINETRVANERLGMKVEQLEKEMKEYNARAERSAAQMTEMLELVRDIKTSMKLANMLAKFIAWGSGIALGVAGLWYSRHG